MIFPCSKYVNCDKSDIPIAGFNSEATDAPTFLSINFGETYNQPRMDWGWFNPTARGVYQSPLPQDDADANAEALQMQNLVGCNSDVDGGCWTDQNGNPVPTYGNQAYTVPLTCPDGLLFEYTVPAGRYLALDPVTANNIAQSFAGSLAYNNSVCLSALTPSTSGYDLPYNGVITATGNYGPFTFSVVAGALPPGVVLEGFGTTAMLAGNPAGAPGAYTFTVMAVDTQGNFMVKTFTLTVTNNPFPWNLINWGAPSLTGTVTGVNFSGGTFGYALPAGINSIDNNGTLTYTAPPAYVTLTVVISNNTITGTTYAEIEVHLGTPSASTALLFQQYFGKGVANGTYVFNFSIPAGNNQPMYVRTVGISNIAQSITLQASLT